MILRIWFWGYRPFLMGGEVNGPVATDIDVGERVELGKGFYGYVIVGPKHTVVVEETSGAVVGNVLEDVRHDIETGEQHTMDDQVAWAIQQRERADVLSNDEFWRIYR